MSTVNRTTTLNPSNQQRVINTAPPRIKAMLMTVVGRRSPLEASDDNCNLEDADGDATLRNTVRLEKVAETELTGGEQQDGTRHVVSGGPFNGVTVCAVEALPVVRKPNIRMEFNVYLGDKTDDSKYKRRETRELLFWFSRRLDVEDQKSKAAQYFKMLVEPETFPRDYVGYIKKAMFLLWHFPPMRRVQLALQLEPEPEPEIEESIPEEQPIENFITVLTPAVYDYQYLPEVAVSKKSHVTFRVRAGADAHIALSTVYGDTDRKTYELVLGGWNNCRSAIRYGGRGPVVVQADTKAVLDPEDFKAFWISWDSDILQVGSGSKVGKERLMRWTIPKDKRHSINCMSVSTGPGSDGQWEFVEYIAPSVPKSDMKSAKRDWVRRAVLWHTKKSKMLEALEEAFPASLSMADLLKRSRVSLTDMLEAVVFLKDLLTRGLVIEISRGIWLRSPVTPSTVNELKIVKQYPDLSARESPTVAIVTSLFCEKLAADMTLDSRVTYVRHNTDPPSTNSGLIQSYTLGRIGEQRVVVMKLPLLYSNAEATAQHGDVVTNFLAMFDKVQHVLIVGVGGAVPNFSEFDRHVRLGDIVVSAPQAKNPSGPIYLHCQDISHDSDGDRFYATRVWDARRDSSTQTAVRNIVDYYCSVKPSTSRRDLAERRPWERVADEVERRLATTSGESDFTIGFHRPPAKSDRLFAVLESGGDPVLVKHPSPPPGSEHLHRENLPNVRCGVIASGRVAAHNPAWRMEVSDSIVAFDRGLHEIIDVLDVHPRLNGYITVLGIADYVDGCKGRTWQPYASLCAAAFAKSLVGMLATVRGRGSYYH